jgi:membrane-associated protease RseP (regulator of RpoE activity)
MHTPKHLWAEGWQRESAAVSEELAERRAKPRDPVPDVVPPPRRRPRRRPSPRLRKGLPIAVAALLLLAAAAYGLSSVLGSTGTPGMVTASHSSGPVDWLGMQIESLQTGVVVVDTVALGSPGELAGMEPGDVIVEVNNKSVDATGDIKDAIAGLRKGDAVEIQGSRGSTRFTTHATLAAPPASSP